MGLPRARIADAVGRVDARREHVLAAGPSRGASGACTVDVGDDDLLEDRTACGDFTKYPGSVHGWGAQKGFRHVWNDVANNELTAVIAGKESVNEMLQKIAAAAR